MTVGDYLAVQKLNAKKYWQYILVGAFILLGIVVLVSLLGRKSSTLENIERIVDEGKEKIKEIKVEKKQIEVRSKIEKEKILKEKRQKLLKLQETEKIEDNEERLNSLIELYKSL